MRTLTLVIDLLLVAVATVLALLLRDNFEISEVKFLALMPYLSLTVAAAGAVLPLFGTTRSVWQFTAMTDYLRICFATFAIVISAVALGFVVNRLDGIARALPILQGLLIVFFLVGVRISMRVRHTARARHMPSVAPTGAGDTVLVVGLNKVAELYLHCVAEFTPNRVRVAGLLDRSERVGRSLHSHPVLGTPEQIAGSLRDLEVHGVFVNRIVVAVPFKTLSAQAQQALLAIEKGTTICLDFLAERMGLDGNTESPVEAVPLLSQPGGAQLCAIRPADVDGLMRSPYRRIKRGLDIVGASILWVLLTPVMLLVGALVALDVGLPVMFWQQRPGLGGRPFKLYKFRTMGPAHDREGRPLSDRERLSAVGNFLRRTRLDELPQLLNILLGDMSFVGPRPLLPVDQPADGSARLLVRPGLTGWAQIKGGRAISAADKAALDLWYVQHASFALDLKIALATVPMVIFGERVSEAAVLQAWHDLQLAGASSSRDLRTSRRGRLALSRM